jgi:hypothetical protein
MAVKDVIPMKNLLFAVIMAAAASLTAGCVTRVSVNKQPSAVGDASPAPAVPDPQISPDVNFKASNTMPGQPSL